MALTPGVELEVKMREVIVQAGLETHARGFSLEAQNSIDIALLISSIQLPPLNSLCRVRASLVRLGGSSDSWDNGAGEGENGRELHFGLG